MNDGTVRGSNQVLSTANQDVPHDLSAKSSETSSGPVYWWLKPLLWFTWLNDIAFWSTGSPIDRKLKSPTMTTVTLLSMGGQIRQPVEGGGGPTFWLKSISFLWLSSKQVVAHSQTKYSSTVTKVPLTISGLKPMTPVPLSNKREVSVP